MLINVHRLLIPALLGIGAWLLSRWREKPIAPRHDHAANSYEEMARCAYCGVYLPQSRAFGDNRRGYFCTEEHRQVSAGGRS